ncbi:MAG TPA: hypothetical protein VK028_15125 [Micromonosporaceae bacterium]|nr:hypothetical protein [Micromonosporaceae bacterium]
MADIYEFLITMDLRDDLSNDEIADLRWHLGLGPQPKRLAILTAFPVVTEDDDGQPQIKDEPRPLLAERGAAWKVSGALCAELARRDQPAGWALTVRQELHPDDFDLVRKLLDWLAGHTKYHNEDRDAAGLEVFVGYLRWYEDLRPCP